jgi:hypothetical protein
MRLFDVHFLSLLLINLVSVLILMRGIYYRYSTNRDALLGLTMFGIGVFLVAHLLHDIEMSMGFAFGLFAVFSMLRYRTESIPIRDMTYLFLVIVIALITAVVPADAVEILFINMLICLLARLAETKLLAPRTHEKLVIYENIDNIKPANHRSLLQDLLDRTGLDIHRFEIENIDFLRDIAHIRIFYHESSVRQTASFKVSDLQSSGSHAEALSKEPLSKELLPKEVLSK